MEPEPQENHRGISRVPLHTIGDLSAVKRQTPSNEEDLGLGNTDMEAPESTRNSKLERMSFRKRRVELQNSSGAEATRGEPAGWTGVSTCLTTRFPTRTKFPTVIGILTMLLVEPTESRRSRRPGRRSWSRRLLGERRRLHRERRRLHRERRPQGAGGHKVHLQVFGEKVQRGRRNSTLIKFICFEGKGSRMGYLFTEKMQPEIYGELSEKQPPEDEVQFVIVRHQRKHSVHQMRRLLVSRERERYQGLKTLIIVQRIECYETLMENSIMISSRRGAD